MSIYLVTGQPGHGKSYYAVRELMKQLDNGKYVATNVELTEGWELVFARSNFVRRLWPGKVAEKAEDFARRVHVVEDLTQLMRLRIPGCGTCKRCRAGGTCNREERGVAVLDEAHNWLNARTWDQDETGGNLSRSEAVNRRLSITRFFSQHRKLGWRVILITQNASLLDAQVRNLYEYHTAVRSVRKLATWWNPLRWLPWQIFVAVTGWHDPQHTRVGVEAYTLNKGIAGLYDTMATSGGPISDEDVILLGQPRLSGAAFTDDNDGLDPRNGPSPFAAPLPLPSEGEAT